MAMDTIMTMGNFYFKALVTNYFVKLGKQILKTSANNRISNNKSQMFVIEEEGCYYLYNIG